jgi:hypothetical protein
MTERHGLEEKMSVDEETSAVSRSPEEDHLQYGVDGHVATITINRPDKLNAMTVAMDRRLNALVYENVNNGVYRTGFATSQEAYEEAVVPLFETLDQLERHHDRQLPRASGDELSPICRAFDAWDKFRHADARRLLQPYQGQFVPWWRVLGALADDSQGHGFEWVEDLLFNELARGQRSERRAGEVEVRLGRDG